MPLLGTSETRVQGPEFWVPNDKQAYFIFHMVLLQVEACSIQFEDSLVLVLWQHPSPNSSNGWLALSKTFSHVLVAIPYR